MPFCANKSLTTSIKPSRAAQINAVLFKCLNQNSIK